MGRIDYGKHFLIGVLRTATCLRETTMSLIVQLSMLEVHRKLAKDFNSIYSPDQCMRPLSPL